MHDEQMFRLLEKFIVLDNVRAVFQKRKAELRILATRKTTYTGNKFCIQ